jgi:hypothetical protein
MEIFNVITKENIKDITEYLEKQYADFKVGGKASEYTNKF